MTTDEAAMWERKESGDLDARNELVVRYEKTALSLVWSRYNGNIIHRGDWESEMDHFLIQAVDGYSLGRGTKFTTFLRACLQLAVTTADNLGLNVVRLATRSTATSVQTSNTILGAWMASSGKTDCGRGLSAGQDGRLHQESQDLSPFRSHVLSQLRLTIHDCFPRDLDLSNTLP